ncbi:MAG: hypothetical protein AAGA48_33340 [Myxococcota bacterium]
MRFTWLVLLMACVETQRNAGGFCIGGTPVEVTVVLSTCRSSSLDVTQASCEVIEEGDGRYRIDSLYRVRTPGGLFASRDIVADCNVDTATCPMPSLPEGQTLFVRHGDEVAVVEDDWSGESMVCSGGVDTGTLDGAV